MSQLNSIIKKLPYPFQKALLTLLYRKNGKILKDYMVFNNGQFYLYDIDGTYIPSEGLSWYLDYNDYLSNVNKISAFAYKPKKGDVIIDIGAGIGEEVIVFSRMADVDGQVYAIEANPELFPLLQQVKERNKLINVQIFNIAINAMDEAVTIVLDQESFKSGTLGNDQKSGKSYKVPGLRFDSFAKENKIDKINFLKVNIEGAERFVIESIGDYIRKVENVAISCHDFRFDLEKEKNPFFKTKKLVIEYLSDNGFVLKSQAMGISYIDDWVYGTRKN